MDRRSFFQRTIGALVAATLAPSKIVGWKAKLWTTQPSQFTLREFSAVWDVSWKFLRASGSPFAAAIESDAHQKAFRYLNADLSELPKSELAPNR